MKPLLYFIPLLLVFAACQQKDSKTGKEKNRLREVASSDKQWTGIAISEDARIFVNFPRWSSEHHLSVAEIDSDSSLIPFPDQEWNSWDPSQKDPENHFVCVQSVVMDDENHLWVLDAGNPQFRGIVPYGPKLIRFDIQTGIILNRVIFGTDVLFQTSYLNDVRIDTDSKYAYITDSNNGAILVYNYENGNVARMLDQHFSTQPELPLVINGKPWLNGEGNINFVASDGIALDREKQYLYYHSLSGLSLYRIDTRYLQDTESKNPAKNHVEFVARTGASDGMITGPDNAIYHSNVEKNAIIRYQPDGSLETVVRDERIKWPDSFAFGPEGYLYFTTSQIHIREPQEPYKIYRIKTD